MVRVYLGRQPGNQRKQNLGGNVVKSLVAPWYQSGRNIVGDNLFSSIPLAEELLSNGLTYIGTVRKNKAEIPACMTAKNRAEFSSIFGFSDQMTLVSYVPKKGKEVIVLSSMHHDKTVLGDQHKPEIIIHYNETKSGG